MGSVATILLLLGGMGCSEDQTKTQSAGNAPLSAGSGALGSTWADAGRMPDLFSGMWMTFSGMVDDDARLNVPYTAKAQKYVAAYKPKRDIPYAQEGCRSPGLPIAMHMGGGIKFTYAPGLISIYMQGVGHTRFIRMNQQQGKTSPRYYGNSVGHWEGDTLVVESEDFLPETTFQYGVGKALPPAETVGTANLGAAPSALLASLSAAIMGPHGEGMRIEERMRLVNAETLEVKLTIYDDTVWTKPYVAATRNYRRIQKGVGEIGPFSGEPEEWVCTVSITSFDPDTNTYVDKDPEAMVKFLDQQGR
jgi:hypothetical protein